MGKWIDRLNEQKGEIDDEFFADEWDWTIVQTEIKESKNPIYYAAQYAALQEKRFWFEREKLEILTAKIRELEAKARVEGKIAVYYLSEGVDNSGERLYLFADDRRNGHFGSCADDGSVDIVWGEDICIFTTDVKVWAKMQNNMTLWEQITKHHKHCDHDEFDCGCC